MFKGLGDMAGMLKQAQEMKKKMEELKENAAKLRIEASAGGEMVKVEVSGDMKLTSLTIDPSLIVSGDQEMIEDLVVSAVNMGLEKMKSAQQEEMAKLTGGIDMSGMGDALSKLGL